jgi:threonine/homoserine/homoserine lactone efflux protein
VCADSFFLFLTLFGTRFFPFDPRAIYVTRWLSALILFGMGFHLLGHSPTLPPPNYEKHHGLLQSFMAGFLLVICNPAILLLWMLVTGYLTLHFPNLHIYSFRILFLSGFLTGGLLWFYLLSHFILKQIRQLTQKHLRFMGRMTSFLLIATGCLILTGRVG